MGEVRRARDTTLARGGAAVVITSHILERVQKLCSRIVLLRDGATALDSAVEALISSDSTRGPRNLESVVLEVLGLFVDERDVLSWMEHEV